MGLISLMKKRQTKKKNIKAGVNKKVAKIIADRTAAREKYAKKNTINSKVPKGFIKFFNIVDYMKDWAQLYIFVMKRNVGKTHSVLMLFFKEWKKQGLGFAIIRRTKLEMDEFKRDSDDFFKENGFRRVGSTIYDAETNEIAGTLVTISQGYAKASTKLDTIWNVIFDEFIAHNGVYVKWEFRILANLLKTLTRFRKGRIFMMSNPVDSSDPYISKFGLLGKNSVEDQSRRLIFKYFDEASSEKFYTPRSTEDIAYIFAMHDKSTMDMMFNGTWARDTSANIIALRDINGLNPEYVVSLEEEDIIVGEDLDGKLIFTLNDKTLEGETDHLERFALTTADSLNNQDAITPRDYDRFINPWVNAMKNGNALFTSFEVREIITEYVKQIKGKRLHGRK